MRYLCFFILIVLNANVISAQENTVGLIHSSNQVSEGYVLFSPVTSKKTYLIDNCGKEINSWESDFNPGLMAYLNNEGQLIRTARTNIVLNLGGSGGRIEIFNWDGSLSWSEDFVENGIAHHDIEILPNGNLLLLLWDPIPMKAAYDLGRIPNSVDGNFFVAEKIWEIKPLENSGYELVWEWKIIDHILQDYDPNLPDYDLPENQPQRIDINTPKDDNNQDWIHFNSISYNAERDEILLSSRNLDEIFIIDHSTTTEQASGSTGGNKNQGGDILYRWGNPQNYGRGSETEKKLHGQHDAAWAANKNFAQISIFNNGDDRPEGPFSSIDLLTPPYDNGGLYSISNTESFGPANAEIIYPAVLNEDFFSGRISGAEILENGNTLITNGRKGQMIEVNQQKQIIWNYINPVNFDGPTSQGNPGIANDVFKARRYHPAFPGFDGKDLSPSEPIELNWIEDDCMTTALNEFNENLFEVNILPNPFSDQIWVENNGATILEWKIANVYGHILEVGSVKNKVNIDVSDLKQGIYYLFLSNTETPYIFTEIIIKQ